MGMTIHTSSTDNTRAVSTICEWTDTYAVSEATLFSMHLLMCYTTLNRIYVSSATVRPHIDLIRARGDVEARPSPRSEDDRK